MTETPTTETVRVWLAERTYSDDEQNVVILEYATPDGTRYLRRERALPSLDDERSTPVSLDVSPERLADVRNEAVREQYAAAVADRRDEHAPGEEL